MKSAFTSSDFGSNPRGRKYQRRLAGTRAGALGCVVGMRWIGGCLAFALAWPALASAGAGFPSNKTGTFHPEFDRDIRPILAENCYPCHGPDENKRKAKLRLDRSENALKALPNGEIAIVPGDPARSKLIERITAKNQDDVMPPVKTGKRLTEQQIASITRWISDGAVWQNHWSFIAPRRPVLPAVKNKK
jgi:hypothetical protein